MSNVAKTSTLRVIVPKHLVQRTVTALGPFGKADTQELVLSTGGMTTEIVVRYIKEYTKLRDEFGQTFRQLGIERQPESATPELSKLRTGYSEVEGIISEARGAFQKLQAELERVDRQVLDLEKQIASVDQIRATGFSLDDVLTSWNSKKNALTLEKESLGTRLEGLRKSLAGPLNRSTDQVEETLLVLRGSLRLGEGSSVARIFARLDRPAAPAILDALQRDGVVEQD